MFVQFRQFIEDAFFNAYKAGKLFFDRQGTTLASSSSFFALITVVPFFLLLIRGIGFFLGSMDKTQKYIFILGAKFFPEMAPQLLLKLQMIIKGPLFAESHFTFINFLVLNLSTITFINSIWRGIYLITHDKSVLSWWRIIKGLFIIILTVTMMSLIFVLPPIIIYLIKFLQTNSLTQYLNDNFVLLRPYIKDILHINLKQKYWLNSTPLHFSIIVLYFTVLYQSLFSFRIKFSQALVASILFSFAAMLGKGIFILYIDYVRTSLMTNYGDLYTSVLGIIWVFYLMCFFFYGASVCHIYDIGPDHPTSLELEKGLV